MAEHRLFDPAEPPEWLDPEWWRDREHCDHLGSPTGTHVARLREAANLAARAALMAECPAAPYVVDLGAGDGALLSLLPRPLRKRSFGYDVINNDIIYAQRARAVDVRPTANLFDDLDYPEHPLGPVVVLTEVLEHMADPHGFLAKLHARPEVRYVVASSPHSETPEQHEWNHAWAWDCRGYLAMFRAAGFKGVEYHEVEWSQLWLFEAAR
jgi:2-polyprenyl-3-methyl-5-hydroxy-6-metoxy-1,4-benzoquinol methylase